MELKIKDCIKIKVLNEESLIYDCECNKMHFLNNTAVKVLLLIQEGKTFDEIIQVFMTEYNVAIDELNEDINELIKEFEELELLVKE